LRSSSEAQPVEVASAWFALCWIWVIAILVFFSIPTSKLIGYALPVMPPLALLAALWWERRMAPLPWAGRVFTSLVSLAVITACAANWVATGYTRQLSSADVAAVLQCAMTPNDVVATVDEYPYDLPFYAQLTQPLEVIQDWDTLRQSSGDNWRRELFEGADFDDKAAQSLVPLSRLTTLKAEPRAWVVAPRQSSVSAAPASAGLVPFYEGRAWTLYRSAAFAASGQDFKTCVEKPKNG
jgi:hypothetical protein